MSDEITFKCSKCGSPDFKIPANPKPNDMVVCNGCGASRQYGDIQREAIKQSKKAVDDIIGSIFKS